jgi:hypothetical protein
MLTQATTDGRTFNPVPHICLGQQRKELFEVFENKGFGRLSRFLATFKVT